MRVEDFDFEQEYEKIRESVKKPNILICGATGVGKSSVVNYLFGEEIAPVGSGNPVTSGIDEYKKDDQNVVLYDSEGYEIGYEKLSHFEEEIIGFIDKRRIIEADISNHIHMVWYCISAGNKRVTDYDLKVIKAIADREVSVAVLFTQIDSVDLEELNELKSVISRNLYGIPCFQLSIIESVPKAFVNWTQLIEWSIDNLQGNLKESFIKALKIGLKEKKELINKKVVPGYTATAGAIGAAPIPMADSVALVSLQVSMAMHVLNIYEIDKMKGAVSTAVNSTLTSSVAKLVAKTLTANLIKLLPGFGTIVGAAVNSAVAASFTYAMGYTISELSYRYVDEIYKGNDVSILEIFSENNIKELFSQFYKKTK